MCAPESIEQFIEVFLAVILFGSSSTPYIPSSVRKLSLFLSLPVCSPSSLLPEGGEGGRGVKIKSYDRKKAWPSIESFNTLWCAPYTRHMPADMWQETLSSKSDIYKKTRGLYIGPAD